MPHRGKTGPAHADRRPVLLAGLTLLLGLAITAFAVWTSQNKIEEDAWYRFSLQFNRLDSAVRSQLAMPQASLQGLAGLHAASGGLQAAPFAKWVAAQDFDQQLRGITGYGFIERVPASDKRAEQFIIRATEPSLTNQGLLGVDVGADPMLRENLQFIVASGEPSLTNLPLQASTAQTLSEYLLVTPLYRTGAPMRNEAERRDALLGLLFARVELNALLLPSVSVAEGQLDFTLSDGEDRAGSRVVFSSQSAVGGAASTQFEQPIEQRHHHNRRGLVMGGKLLYLHAGSTPAFTDQTDHQTPPLVGLVGSLLSLLLAMTFWLVLNARGRAEALAHAMTRDLKRLAHIAQNTSHLVFVLDAQSMLVWANQAFCTFTRMPLEDLADRPIRLLLRLDNQRNVEFAQVLEDLQCRENLRVQTPITSPDGIQRWFDLDLQPERDASGMFLGYIVIAADITAQRAAMLQEAAALRDRESLLAAIDQHSIVSITDAAGTITYANEMFSQISGYSQAELIGSNHRLVKSSVQSDAYWERMWKTISSGYNWRDTVCNQAKDGRLYWVDTVIAPFFDAAGQIEKYISIRADVTQARMAQAQIKEERAHLQAIIEGTNAGTWEWDVDSGKNIVNARWAEMLGYTLEELGELSVKKWESLCHPDDMAEPDAMSERHFKGEVDHFEREFRMRHRDGHWLWVQSRGKVTSWHAPGKPAWVSGIHLDITAQKNLQAELHQSNRVMQSILDNIPVGLSVFDSDLRLIARNDKFLELLQFPPALFEGAVTTFESLTRFNAERGEYGPGDVETIVREVVERARHTTSHQFERDRPDGTALEVRGGPMPGGGFITTYADISQRRLANAEVQRTTRMLQSVLDAASEVAVITIGLDGLISLFNVGAERMLGYRSTEVIGQHAPDIFFDPAELQARNSAMSASLGRSLDGLDCLVDDSVLGRRCEWTYVHKDGHHFTAALVVTAMLDAHGQRSGYLGVSHDITLEKEHARKLQIAMEEAEQASTAKSQFLANMSHEIRTPMNAILGMLKLLQNTPLDPRQQDYTTKTEGAARSLLGLLNDILDFSKAEAGKMELDPQPFALDRLLRDLSVILSANVGRKGIEVVFELDPALPALLVGDSLRLQQILINLGGNAIKFTEEGEVVVSLVLQERLPDAARIRVAVRDSGIGIDPKNQKHIFAGFSQAEASTTRRFGGTGLGLSICKRLIALMGGELELQSALGQGSTFAFTITLPLAQDAQDAPARLAANPLHTPAQGDPAPAVLVVDDNPVARRAIAVLAGSLGWQVVVAATVPEALALSQARTDAAQPPWAAIFLDWHMPGMDGWEAKRQLRASPWAQQVPLVVMATAQARESMSEDIHAEENRLESCVVKPVTASMLQGALQEARQQTAGPAPRGAKPGKVQRLQGLRLLVVEDNLINQQVAKELLMGEGAHITLAGNGQLGVDAIAQAAQPFDAVLMDLQMPVMDGYTASVTIRHELGLRDLPVIAMTANAMASDREACLAAGMNDHIGKPFDLNQLVDMLLRHTGREGGILAPMQAPPATPAADPVPASAPAQVLQVQDALALLGNNDDLYYDIARAYLSELAQFANQLPGLLAQDDLREAARSLHTIKGLSLTVGAAELAAMCRIGESQIKASLDGGKHPSDLQRAQLVADVQASIATTQGALQAYLAAHTDAQAPVPPPATGQALDRERLGAELQQLRGLLASSNMQAVHNFDALRKNHGPALGAQLDGLQAAMAAFDFEQGMVQCDVLIRDCTPITKP